MLATGTQVGGYRIEGVLGRGGMGVVYEAVQLSLSRTVALKVLAAELSDDAGFRDRFRREARVQAIIEHAHIVPIYEAGELDEGLYIAMRLVRGPNLKQLIAAGDLSPERALKILLAVGDALDVAHEAELIHRDIKPQNILIGRNDHAFLADFGLTKGKSDTGYTRTGQLMGTLDYVAPEQIKGELATSASDIYALAAVAYECLVGRPPFSRPTELATLYAHVSDPVPRPSQERPGLPPAVDPVIAAGLAKNPAERPATAVALLTRLGAAFEAPRSATPVKPAPVPLPPPPVAPDPIPADQGTEIVAPLGTPTRDDLRRDWPPPSDEPPPPSRWRRRAPVAATEPMVAEPETARIEPPPAPPEPEPEPEPPELEPVGAPAAPKAAPPRAARAPRARRGVPTWAFAAGAVVVGTVAGLLAGSAAQSDAPAPKGRATAQAGPVSFAAPAGWTASSAGVPVRFEGDAASARSGAGTVSAGMTAGSGATLLPPDLRADKPGEPVKLGDLEAYRYDGIRTKDGEGPLTVYVAPTASGTATVACSGASSADCAAAAASLKVAGAEPLPLGPRAAYAKPVATAVERLQRERETARRALDAAKTPRAQGDAAAGVATAYGTAAGRLAAVKPSPLEAAAHPALVAAARDAQKAWTGLAADARAGRRGAYTGERAAVARTDDEVRAALRRLRELGYRIG